MVKKLFISILILIIFSNNASAFSIPYEGWTPKWDSYLDDKKVNSFIYSYDEEIGDSIFKVTNYPDKDVFTYNAKNREVIEGIEYGPYVGTKTSHWIDTDVKIGDDIEIQDIMYQVLSTDSVIELPSIGKISTIELKYDLNMKYYDKITGIKLKEEDFSLYGQFSRIITDSGTDVDNDGLTDFEELLIKRTDPLLNDTDDDGLNDNEELDTGTNPLKADTDGDGLNDNEELDTGTNPLKADTDGDFWEDNIDLLPKSTIIPNGPFILIILILILIIFYKKKNDKNKD